MGLMTQKGVLGIRRGHWPEESMTGLNTLSVAICCLFTEMPIPVEKLVVLDQEGDTLKFRRLYEIPVSQDPGLESFLSK
jgi:hypothetical protein